VTAPVKVYTNAPKKMVEALLALGTLKLFLTTNTFVPDQDANDFANDLTNEAAGTGYTTGGITMASVVVNLDTATNTSTLDAADVSGISVSCRWGFLYVYTGSLATSPLIAFIDFAEGVSGNVTLTGAVWNAAGIVPLVAAA
jgi:hypothetical protein